MADFISRFVDYDDWQVKPELFCYVENVWGPYSFDKLADNYNYNAQLARFNLCFVQCIGTMEKKIGGALHLRVVGHAEACNANGTLVVPHWESIPFWPILCPDSMTFASFVVAYSEMLPGEFFFSRDIRGYPSFLALRISFSPS